MDIATLIGIVGAMALVVAAIIMGGDPGTFINPESIVIVCAGSLFVVLAKFGVKQFASAVKVAAKAFVFKMQPPQDMIDEIVEIADEARKGGLLSLENRDIENEFLQKGIQLLVDGHEPEVVKSIMMKDKILAEERHLWGSKIFSSLGDVAPAMGMIGTLIGLVAMLANMEDPKAIGPAMAVALLTTLYGAIIANVIANPIADKLKLRALEERTLKALIIDALLAIQAGQNPRVIDTLLRNYLPEKHRESSEV